MPELTDDQLDELFRKSAEEFDPPFDPAAWQDMNARLDTNDHTTPAGAFLWKKLLRWGLPVVALLLITGGGWFVYRKATNAERNVLSSTVVSQQPEGNTAAEGSHQAESSRLADAEQANESLASSTERQISEAQSPANRTESASGRSAPENTPDHVALHTPDESVSEVRTATKSALPAYTLTGKPDKVRHQPHAVKVLTANNRRTITTPFGSTHSPVTSLLTRKKRSDSPRRQKTDLGYSEDSRDAALLLTNRQTSRKRTVSTLAHSGLPSDVTLLDSAESTADAPAMLQYDRISNRPVNWPAPLVFSGRDVVAQPDTTVREVVPQVPVQRGLSIRFAVAPDLSGVGLNNFTRPGTNVGLLLEYRLASRWSVQAGVIQSTKVYRALPGEYGYLPDNLERYKSNLAEVDGRCNMLDIPINVRYDVIIKSGQNGRQPTRWFISSGVTSYIMNREDYTYSYYHYYPSNVTNWSTKTGGYGFSNLNLSIGYERALSRRLSWQVEPFMKAPLRGVGYFKINLLSTGAFFSLRYKL